MKEETFFKEKFLFYIFLPGYSLIKSFRRIENTGFQGCLIIIMNFYNSLGNKVREA